MDKAERKALLDQFYQLLEDQEGVTQGKFFGVDVLRVKGQMFLVVTEYGELALRAVDDQFRQYLLALPGTTTWYSHNKMMSQWVRFDDIQSFDSRQLNEWVQKAYEQASTIEEAGHLLW